LRNIENLPFVLFFVIKVVWRQTRSYGVIIIWMLQSNAFLQKTWNFDIKSYSGCREIAFSQWDIFMSHPVV